MRVCVVVVVCATGEPTDLAWLNPSQRTAFSGCQLPQSPNRPWLHIPSLPRLPPLASLWWRNYSVATQSQKTNSHRHLLNHPFDNQFNWNTFRQTTTPSAPGPPDALAIKLTTRPWIPASIPAAPSIISIASTRRRERASWFVMSFQMVNWLKNFLFQTPISRGGIVLALVFLVLAEVASHEGYRWFARVARGSDWRQRPTDFSFRLWIKLNCCCCCVADVVGVGVVVGAIDVVVGSVVVICDVGVGQWWCRWCTWFSARRRAASLVSRPLQVPTDRGRAFSCCCPGGKGPAGWLRVCARSQPCPYTRNPPDHVKMKRMVADQRTREDENSQGKDWALVGLTCSQPEQLK